MSHVEWHIIRILCDENGMLPERVSYSYLVEDICILSSAIRNYVLTRNQRRKNVIDHMVSAKGLISPIKELSPNTAGTDRWQQNRKTNT